MFLLCAYLLMKVGDMQAFKANQYIKGPNTFSPCQVCRIQGCRNPTLHKNYYYPLMAPAEGAVGIDHMPPQSWYPCKLPPHTDQGYKNSIAFIQAGDTQTEHDHRAKMQGINGKSILVYLPGFSRSASGPHEWMHLILKQLVPGMVDLWTDRFKGLNKGEGAYQIPRALWELIGRETAAACPTIPAVFCRTLPNIATECYLFTAEARVFWTINLAPCLLEGQLADKYYQHFLMFIDIMKICLQVVITEEEIDVLEDMIIKWVQDYEELFFIYSLTSRY
ncbi:hypothetical protein K439DRAFT_1372420 [Ramaria rubella]|nr:hypothetical protein K439DRAFT_1372420 [Ramaria rubella]